MSGGAQLDLAWLVRFEYKLSGFGGRGATGAVDADRLAPWTGAHDHMCLHSHAHAHAQTQAQAHQRTRTPHHATRMRFRVAHKKKERGAAGTV